MSRLETGTIKIQKQNVLLADTLAMAISNVVIKADKKNIKIDVQYDEQLMLKHDKKWTAEDYVRDQFEKAMQNVMLRPEDKVVK